MPIGEEGVEVVLNLNNMPAGPLNGSRVFWSRGDLS